MDLLKMTSALAATALVTEGLIFLGVGGGHLDMLYCLCVLLVARYTGGYLFGVLAAVIGSISLNYFITQPRMAFNLTQLPAALAVLLFVAVAACALTARMKNACAGRQALCCELKKEKMRGVLLSAVSHDIRTPLAGILSAGSVIEEQAGSLEPGAVKSIASDIKANSQWLIRVVENLLCVTRVSSGGAKVEKTAQAAQEIMAESAAMVRRRFPQCDIRIEAPDEPVFIFADPILISQVFINLLENAVKYSPVASPVRFSLHSKDEGACFEIDDQGRGVSGQIVRQLNENDETSLDQRIDSSSGIGIGLLICKTITAAHGGQIKARGKPGGGTVFSVILPGE